MEMRGKKKYNKWIYVPRSTLLTTKVHPRLLSTRSNDSSYKEESYYDENHRQTHGRVVVRQQSRTSFIRGYRNIVSKHNSSSA